MKDKIDDTDALCKKEKVIRLLGVAYFTTELISPPKILLVDTPLCGVVCMR